MGRDRLAGALRDMVDRLGPTALAQPAEGTEEGQRKARGAKAGQARKGRLRTAVGAWLFAALCALTLLFPSLAFAEQGYWRLVGSSDAPGASASNPSVVDEYHWYKVVDSGTDVDMFADTGREAYRKTSEAHMPGSAEATGYEERLAVPDSGDGVTWTRRPTAGYSGYATNEDGDAVTVDANSPVLGTWDADKHAWTGDSPSWTLKPGEAVVFLLCNIVGTLIMRVTEVGVRILAAIDVRNLLVGEWGSSGMWGEFFTVANGIVNKISVPVGSAFMTLAFVLHLIRLTDSRRYGGRAWFETLLRTLAYYLAASVLIIHSMEVMGAIYWAASRITSAVLGELGSVSMAEIGSGMLEAFSAEIGTITYDNWASIIVLALIVFMPISHIVQFAITVFTTCFMRIVEIYLRAAFVAVPLSFLVNEEMRPIAVNYLKRFAGCCFMAVVFAGALGLTNVLSNTVQGFFSVALADAEGIVATLKAVAPIVITLISIDSIIKKSGEIANSLFGV